MVWVKKGAFYSFHVKHELSKKLWLVSYRLLRFFGLRKDSSSDSHKTNLSEKNRE